MLIYAVLKFQLATRYGTIFTMLSKSARQPGKKLHIYIFAVTTGKVPKIVGKLKSTR